MKRITPFALLAFLLVACSGTTRHAAAPIVSVAPATTTTVDPTVVPPVITVGYLNAVLAKLDHVYGDAVREFVAKRDVTQAVNIRLRSIYNDPLYQEQLKIFSEALAQPFSNYRMPPGDPHTTVSRILTSSTSCVWLETQRDYGAVTVVTEPVAPSQYMAISARPSSRATTLNPTAWIITANVTYPSMTPPPQDPCGAS